MRNGVTLQQRSFPSDLRRKPHTVARCLRGGNCGPPLHPCVLAVGVREIVNGAWSSQSAPLSQRASNSNDEIVRPGYALAMVGRSLIESLLAVTGVSLFVATARSVTSNRTATSRFSIPERRLMLPILKEQK